MNKKIFYTFLVALAGWLVASPVLALTVSPAKLEVTADPGQTYRGEIEIFNEQDVEKTFFTSYENFEPQGDSGAPYFIGAEDGLATWIDTEDQYVVESGERLVVPYSITIPAGTEPGGYFAAIFFGSQPPQGNKGGEVTVGGKIGVLILLRVSGEVEEGGGLLDFTIVDNKRFFSVLPIDFEYRFNNSGGDRVVPLGEIEIKNTLRRASTVLLANTNKGSVLPGSARKFLVSWGDESVVEDSDVEEPGFFATAGNQWKDFHFGWYTATVNISWGESNQTADSTYNFFILPWQLLIVLIVVILLVVFVGKTMLRKYKRSIIAQATDKQQ